MEKVSIISLLFLATVLTFPQATHSSNILVWGAVSSRSVRLSMTPFIEALAEKGHNVTFIAVMEDSEVEPYKKAKVNVFLPKKWRDAMGSWENDEMNFYNLRKTLYGVPKSWYDFRALGVAACEVLYSDPEFLSWVKASPKYDLVIVEMAMINECAYGLVQFWNSKLAIYSTTSVVPGFMDSFGLPDESSSISDITIGFPPGNQMSFLQRFVNALNPIVFGLTKEYFYFPQLEEVTRRGWKALGRNEKDLVKFSETERTASLIFLTTHFSLDFPRSFPPNVVPVGGAVVTKTNKPLTKEMESFLASASEGFIYINFGTIVQFVNFDESVQINFINALKQFPKIMFLWSTGGKIGMPLPDNVMVSPWTPQQTVLAHPKIKAFITHSGMGATAELIHFSVPVITIPILAEQDSNAHVIASRGAGIKLEIVGLKQEQLQHAISEILTNEKYRLQMNKLTKAFKDRPVPPIENAVWWTEYILRHENSNEFLLSPGVKQPWWKRRQIDVWVTAAILVSLIVSIPLCLLYAILRRLFGSSGGNGKSEKLKRN